MEKACSGTLHLSTEEDLGMIFMVLKIIKHNTQMTKSLTVKKVGVYQ